VGHAINYIRSLEKTKAMLEKRKQELALARQADAEAVASSSSAPPPPQTAHGMALAAMSSDVPDACSGVPPLQPTVPGATAAPGDHVFGRPAAAAAATCCSGASATAAPDHYRPANRIPDVVMAEPCAQRIERHCEHQRVRAAPPWHVTCVLYG
jgi:hypothetical protein